MARKPQRRRRQPPQPPPPLHAPSLPDSDPRLRAILRRGGAYYQSGKLFYQRLWRQELIRIGFRVISVEKIIHHHLWEIRLGGTLTAQTYLLLSTPGGKVAKDKDVLVQKLRAEVRRIAQVAFITL